MAMKFDEFSLWYFLELVHGYFLHFGRDVQHCGDPCILFHLVNKNTFFKFVLQLSIKKTRECNFFSIILN